jgi:hypothetical protein
MEDNMATGYDLFGVNRDPGLEIQRDDELNMFPDNDAARLQFVADLERGVPEALAIARDLLYTWRKDRS